MIQPYPWQQKQWRWLQSAIQINKLPHALLLHGIEGLGKAHFAKAVSFYLLCESTDVTEKPCGECRACQLLIANTHPDQLIITPEDKTKPIKIDQIHQVGQFLQKTSYSGAYRIVMLAPTEAMNHSAANAFLKTLEEPGHKCFIMLISHHPAALLATIKSRCQTLHFQPVTQCDPYLTTLGIDAKHASEMDILLCLAQGAPLKAQALFNKQKLQQRNQFITLLISLFNQQIDPVLCAENQFNLSLDEIVDYLFYWITDLIKLQFSMTNYLVNRDYPEQLQTLSSTFKAHDLFKILDYCIEIKHNKLAGINLNPQLLLEDLFIACHNIAKQKHG